ncbi:MarC family protein [Nocardioides alcanivorans]|uniref:MarC family protein n=1 Tax=Nocardioides alcanivorans TaxID=2897352 RepID=UPI001F3DF9D0|nr:MarC family protein [Nocardioides alcanivorans]
MDSVINVVMLTEVFVTLFVIMDPPGTIPVFLSLTAGRAPATIKRAAWQAVAVSFLVITLFALFGHAILRYMHISIPALQGAGGLLLLLVALQLLMSNDKFSMAGSGDTNVALVPLGTPLLAGPGAIVATMLFVQSADSGPDVTALVVGIVAVHAMLWLSMRFSLRIMKLIREGGVMLITKIAGLLLSAIAVQMVADAVRAFVLGEG